MQGAEDAARYHPDREGQLENSRSACIEMSAALWVCGLNLSESQRMQTPLQINLYDMTNQEMTSECLRSWSDSLNGKSTKCIRGSP